VAVAVFELAVATVVLAMMLAGVVVATGSVCCTYTVPLRVPVKKWKNNPILKRKLKKLLERELKKPIIKVYCKSAGLV
jgi:hypothetical protein